MAERNRHNGELAHGVFVMRRVVVLDGGAAPLGHVHAYVCVAQQRVCVIRIVGVMRDANADADFDRDPATSMGERRHSAN
jgi:hypothetical protein